MKPCLWINLPRMRNERNLKPDLTTCPYVRENKQQKRPKRSIQTSRKKFRCQTGMSWEVGGRETTHVLFFVFVFLECQLELERQRK